MNVKDYLGKPESKRRNTRPFVIIKPYQFEGDVAFGVWDEKHNGYILGDGDIYTVEQLAKMWPDADLLTWSEMEGRLK